MSKCKKVSDLELSAEIIANSCDIYSREALIWMVRNTSYVRFQEYKYNEQRDCVTYRVILGNNYVCSFVLTKDEVFELLMLRYEVK